MQAECVQTVEDQLHPHQEYLGIQFQLSIQRTFNLINSHKHRATT